MGLPVGDVLSLPPADTLAPCCFATPASSYFLIFFLPAMAMRGPLRVRALVWVRWPRTGQAAPVADALVAADLDLALDVLLDVPAQVPLDLVVLLDEPPDPHHLVVGELADLGGRVDSGLVHISRARVRPIPYM